MDLLSFMQDNVLILDGGMGTLLQAAGLNTGESPETWVLTHPDIIRDIHRSYYAAGSHVVLTDTFGANLLHFSEDELRLMIDSAVRLARQAAASFDGPHFVGLDIGPTGRLLKPYGDLDFENAVKIFSRTVSLGVEAGVDLLFIETMNDSYETKAALLAAKECSTLPVFVSNAYGADGKLMTGADPEAMVAMLEGMHATAVGTNCSLGPQALRPTVDRYLSSASVPVLVKPNAGLPHVENGKTVYDIGPEDFADAVAEMVHAGVRICGGGCGTTPEYIRALSERLKDVKPLPCLPKHRTVISSYTHAVSFGDRPLLIGERVNPTGKKLMKQALLDQDYSYILREGIGQQDAGADILDVNVGVPGIDEPATLKTVVAQLQSVVDLPLQIDTSNPAAMEAALRLYNGKPLINSVSGKKESMDAVFPLQKKYGGALICLTLDENGIPEQAEGRANIALRILAYAEAYGISKDDLIFDPLAMSISSSDQAALVTLEALQRIHDMGCHTILGISNVSFGLPSRDGINSAYFLLALEKGLSAAIMNPYAYDMMRSYHAYLALHGMDDHCLDYIRYVSEHAPAAQSPAVTKPSPVPSGSDLQQAIVKGLKIHAAELTKQLLTENTPMRLISDHLIPALDTVGKQFEEKTLFLPQLLMSAEAANASFEVIRPVMLNTSQKMNRSKFVLATVHGDIHDIGKNIVHLLMESYGFQVIDLGKDVSKETILQAVLDHHAPLCGLSALMTTTVPAMEETVQLLHEKAPFCRIIVGGAVLTQAYAEQIHADFYAKDALSCVRIAEKLENPSS